MSSQDHINTCVQYKHTHTLRCPQCRLSIARTQTLFAVQTLASLFAVYPQNKQKSCAVRHGVCRLLLRYLQAVGRDSCPFCGSVYATSRMATDHQYVQLQEGFALGGGELLSVWFYLGR
ncbi:hypothetical protein J6590_103709 [Homalodisca vitripennis]|nr:hypothetical protein J6590_103709 [Homalodisca vitripennis]